MTKKNKRGNKNTMYGDLKSLIKELLSDQKNREISQKQIIKKIGARDKKTKNAVKAILADLSKNDPKGQRNSSAPLSGIEVTGKVDFVNPRVAFIISEDLEKDVMVKAENLKFALDDDTVKVQLFKSNSKGARAEGKVVEIISRFRTEFVGRVEVASNYAFVVPDFKKMHYDIFVGTSNLNKATHDDKVIVEITKWPERNKSPEGKVTSVLGKSGENNAEIHSIMAEFGLPFNFPDNVDEQASKIKDGVTKEEVLARRDFRDVLTFTIDPLDAKDFDDALSLQKLKNGNWEVGVHIADVTHYVRPNTLIETEAQERATSVYLVDRVVPMLPERLSNGVCSLRPNEDKLCFSAVFELDEQANIKKEWFGKTAIHSDRRFSYEEAQEVIESGEGELSEEILTLDKLAKELRDKRFKKGSIAFDRFELKFNIDENGKPLSVYFKESKDSNKLIEEFMLLANKKVAEFIGNRRDGKTPKTFVYRIHDKPDPDRLETLNTFISRFGYGLQLTSATTITNSLNKLLSNVKGKKEQNLVETLAIRTMAKAAYSTRNIGHYGLAFEHYSHFTSPIRRYPDMMVHRLLEKYLEGKQSANEQKYEGLCKHSSEMETKAAKAERSSIKYKQVEFMQDHLGKIYPGVISGITDWGIYVELQNKIEGMVPLRELDDDFYILDEKNYALVGKHSNKTYQLGDEVTVKIWRTNMERKQLDFLLTEGEEIDNFK
jgi:ribonuclease R